MGIRGFTTFIQSRSHIFMENFELHDTNIVIDGNSIACQLYNWHTKSNDCFGGDYDKYGQVVFNFYRLLKLCNVTPYVVFDGGYESKKLRTVITRMKNRIKIAQKLDYPTSETTSVFPLFLRETFLDITIKLGLKVVRCDFESDTETANIARALNCPVLSYDSDFFILDVFYIPFSSLEMSIKNGKKSSIEYIPCQIYKVEKFLNFFGGLEKDNLPLLAVLLGNDYINRSVFSMFYQNLKMQKCHGSEEQKRIKSLIVWLQNETQESAIQKVLSRFKSYKRKIIADKIKKAIEGYSCCDSIYLKYLGIMLSNTKTTAPQIDFESLIESCDEVDPNDNDEEEEENTDESYDLTDDFLVDNKVSNHFLQLFRKCYYPSCFMDMIIQNKYYCIPQVEDYTSEHSHTVSIELIGVIHKILCGGTTDKSLNCVVRTGSTNVGTVKIPVIEGGDLPNISEVVHLDVKRRQGILLSIVGFPDEHVRRFLNMMPKSWHLFILSILYMINKANVSWPFIYSLIICKLILEQVDSKIGYYRCKKSLIKHYPNISNNMSDTFENNNTNSNNTSKHFDNLSIRDCVTCLSATVTFFQVDAKLERNNKLFDRQIVHSISQFQSCLLHIRYLNSLLMLPFENCLIAESLNCTFVYNLVLNFRKRSNLNGYIEENLLTDSKTVLQIFQLITSEIEKIAGDKVITDIVNKRRKKKKKSKCIREDDYENQSDLLVCQDEILFDPNNKFSILSCS